MPLCHLGTQVLESERLTLRPFVITDAQAMFEYASDMETTKFMRFPTHKSIQDSKDILTIWTNNYESSCFYNWAIICKECNELIGSIGLVDINEFHQLAEVGYIIRKDHWRKGIATEALKRVIQFCFEDVHFNRIMAIHSIENPVSGKVMEKVGLKKEGILRNYFPTDHGFIDCCLYAITQSDYTFRN